MKEDMKVMSFESMEAMMKNPQIAKGFMNMAAGNVQHRWTDMIKMTLDALMTLRSHGHIEGVEDIMRIYVEEVVSKLAPVHQQYAQVFENNPIDYAAVKAARDEVKTVYAKYVSGVDAKSMVAGLMAAVPTALTGAVMDLGTAYQNLMFVHNKAKAGLKLEALEQNREYFIKISRDSWDDMMKAITDVSHTDVPEDIVARSEREHREFERLIREGLSRDVAIQESVKTVSKIGSKESFYNWFDKEFGIDGSPKLE